MREKIKAFFKNRMGMTYIELLVALSLLCLIMVAFTPMLLKSYETLYGAGELSEATYEGKQEIEEGLATRVVKDVTGLNVSLDQVDLGDNISNLVSNFYLGLRNITSSTQFSLETLFYGGRGRLNVLSSSVMRDDYDAKEIVIQAEGVNLVSLKHGNKNSLDSSPEGSAVVRVYLPDYTKSTEEDGFGGKYVGAEGTGTSFSNLNSGAFPLDGDTARIEISGVDITTPVLKIVLWYVDENSKIQELSTVVKIEPATITIVGETSGTPDAEDSVAYYTTAGVETEKTASGFSESFRIEGRKMTRGSYPAGTTFLNVQWVGEDTHKDLDPYYVITGNNGTIQRLFVTNSNAVGMSETTYKKITNGDLNGFPYTVDGLTSYTYATEWGGDKSHQFGFSTSVGGDDEQHQSNYSKGCWYTSSTGDGSSYKGKDGVYDTTARMAFYFNGFRFRTSDDERMRDGRIISYVLLEQGYPLRFVGAKTSSNSPKRGGFITTWESPQMESQSGNGNLFQGTQNKEFKFSEDNPTVLRLHYDGWDTDDKALSWDEALAYLNLKGYSNLSPVHALITHENQRGKDSSQDKTYINSDEATNINITASYYNPTTNQMRYLGTTPAYAYVQQTDNTGIYYKHKELCGPEDNGAELYQLTGTSTNKRYHPVGAITGYWIWGNSDKGTTIYKRSTANDVVQYEYAAPEVYTHYYNEGKGLEPNQTDFNDVGQSAEFYVTRPKDGYYASLYDSDLEFTMGYSSNREEVFANITYDINKVEYHNSYERYFNLSHFSNMSRSNGTRDENEDLNNSYYKTDTMTKQNSIYNQTYHVWFPGEFYNLTKTATKEGVTVAVGYTISGSTFQYIDKDKENNTSTALGSVYNDGVLAAVIDTSDANGNYNEANNCFKNLLYYKDYETATFENDNIFNGTSVLSANFSSQYGATDYYNQTGQGNNKNYGTHSRASVRFQAVDIAVVENKNDTVSGDKVTASSTTRTYYAFYGDNRGRVFYSKVASMSSSVTGIGTSSQTSTTNPLALVTGINDIGAETKNAAYGQQTEIAQVKKGNSSVLMKEIFSEITSITCNGNVVIICGTTPAGAGIVMGRIKDDGNVDRFEYFEITPASKYIINDALILNGYIYLVGETDNHGFVASIPYSPIETYITMDETKTYKDENGKDVTVKRSDAKDGVEKALTDRLRYCDSANGKSMNKVYSIAGHA